MRFRVVPKSVTLNDLERRNGQHFASFHRTRVLYDVVVKQLPRFQNLLLIVYDHIKTMCAFVFFRTTACSICLQFLTVFSIIINLYSNFSINCIHGNRRRDVVSEIEY